MNSHNKSFCLNVFLNDTCKGAMNMSEFVDTIKIQMSDLENFAHMDYPDGVSKILLKNLNNLDINLRPIHCSDLKRETLYVKDNNQWQRDGPDHEKMTNAVLAVEQKNVALVNEWAKTHPQCENSETQANQIYMTLAKHATDGDEENVAKVAKQIAKSVIIDKNDY